VNRTLFFLPWLKPGAFYGGFGEKTVGNEGQHKSLSQQGVPAQQQQYYGWQYEQEQAASLPAPLPDYIWQYEQEQEASLEAPIPPVSSQPRPAVQGLPAASPAQSQFRPLRSYGTPSGPLAQPPSAPQSQQYQEPLLDMGSSLGYGQGMEYQYFNAPQPSQPLPVLREMRLQQLRANRMSRTQPSIPNTVPGRTTNSGLLSQFSGPSVPPTPSRGPALWETRRSPLEQSAPGIWEAQRPPTTEPDALSPILQRGPSGLPLVTPSRPLSVPLDLNTTPQKQDTGSIQKVRMARATMILTGSFIVGRVLGLVRTSLFAFIFGTTTTSDAYLQAFLVPDLIFNVVAGGALSSAFIPVFTHYMLGEKDEKTAWRIASSALNLTLAVMCLLALCAIILAPQLVPIYNPGVPPSELNLIISLTRIMLLQAIIMGGGVIVNSVLYARQNFLLPAIGTVLYNVGLIIGLLPGFFLALFIHSNGLTDAQLSFAVYAATTGVILGAALQVGVQIPGVIKERMHYTFAFDWNHPGVRQVGHQMLPRVLNAAMLYFSTFVDRGLILVLAAGPLLVNQQGLITQYYQALQLVLLPLGIFGMAVSTAAFPTMAENVTLGRLDRVRAIIEETLRSILFLSIPSSVALIVLGLPIIQVLLQHGAFDLNAANATSVPLAFFALGLAGLAAVEILTRSFYAFRDSKTPVIISIAQFVLKILLSLLLLHIITWGSTWGLGSLAFSTSVAGLLEAAVLLWLLQKKIGMLRLRQLAMFALRVILASLIMGTSLLLLRSLLDLVLITTTSDRLGILGTFFAIFKLLFELIVGILVYIWGTRQLGVEDFWKQGPVRRLLDRFKLSWI
jgi:putative peptidoglycan lipid II flippase